jgi:hypothetical protein
MRHRIQPHQTERPESRHRTPAPRERVASKVRDVLSKLRVERKPLVEPLPLNMFEHNAHGTPVPQTRLFASQTNNEGYPGYPKHVYLNNYEPLASAEQMRHAVGLHDTRLIGIIRGESIPASLYDREKQAKKRHLQALNTTYILEHAPQNGPKSCVLVGFNTLQQARQIMAAGGTPRFNSAEMIVLEPGQGVVYGRGEEGWLPYKTTRDGLQSDPHYLKTADHRVSKKQAVVGMDQKGHIFVVDGTGDANGTSKNGTLVLHGNYDLSHPKITDTPELVFDDVISEAPTRLHDTVGNPAEHTLVLGAYEPPALDELPDRAPATLGPAELWYIRPGATRIMPSASPDLYAYNGNVDLPAIVRGD